MDKLKLAHDYALVRLTCSNPKTLDEIISLSWYYADAMQAEADKRNKAEAKQKRKEIREILNDANTFIEREGQHFDDVEKWQPDWSQAPEWANYWIKTSGKMFAWLERKPSISNLTGGWNIECMKKQITPSFDYKGNWQDSLRERPHGF